MIIYQVVRDKMQREMESKLRNAGVSIPGVDMRRFTKALAEGVCNGLAKWGDYLTDEIRRISREK